MSKVKALKVVKPYIIPGIGKLDEQFGPFKFDPKTFEFRDAVLHAINQGIFAPTDAPEEDVRKLEMGMPLRPPARVEPPAPAQTPPAQTPPAQTPPAWMPPASVDVK